jgi:hypothetical protein
MLKNFVVKGTTVRKTKGFTQKTMDIMKKGNNETISLKEVKDLAKSFEKEADNNGGKFVIRARNKYRDNLTIRDFNGSYYDENDDYYNSRGYSKSEFDKFYHLQIYYIK